MFSCWSAKGGSGTTVVSVALAVLLGQQSDAGSVYVDLEGDAPTVFGMPEPDGPGLSDWFAASESVGVSAMERLERPVANAVRLVPRGRREFSGDERAKICIERLNADAQTVRAACQQHLKRGRSQRVRVGLDRDLRSVAKRQIARDELK